MKITISKTRWQKIGLKYGWIEKKHRIATLMKVASTSLKNEISEYKKVLNLLKNSQTEQANPEISPQNIVENITVNNVLPYIDMSNYNQSFVVEDIVGETIPPEQAKEIFAMGIVWLINNYSKNPILYELIAHLKVNREFNLRFNLDKTPGKFYLVPSFNNKGIFALRSEFTAFVVNRIGSLHPYGIISISDSARRSSLMETRIEKERKRVPQKIIRNSNDAMRFAYFAGVLTGFGKIKFYPREYTRAGDKMVGKRGKGESFKTTATFELDSGIPIALDDIRDHLSYFTFQASEDKQIIAKKGKYLLAWKSEIEHLSNGLGILGDYHRALDRVEAYERAQENAPPGKRAIRSKVFTFTLNNFKDKIQEYVTRTLELNSKIIEEFGTELHPITRNESEALLLDYFERGLRGAPIA